MVGLTRLVDYVSLHQRCRNLIQSNLIPTDLADYTDFSTRRAQRSKGRED